MNMVMDTDTDGAIRLACRKDRPDYGKLADLALRAVYGLCSMAFHDCFGRADYPAVRECAEKLLESGELKYELAEHCVSEGIKHSTEGPHYIFSYSVLCKGFDGGDAWHAGISPAIYTKASCLLSDGDLPPDGGFDAPDRRRLLPLRSVGARPSRLGGAKVSFDIPVSAFARVLSGERYMELLRAVHRYNMQPQLHCLCLLFDTEGIKKLCRMCVESIMKGHDGEDAKAGEGKLAYGAVLGQPQEAAGQGHPVEATLKKRNMHISEDMFITGCSDACALTAEKREEMWASCRHDLETAGIFSKTSPEGLYKVLPGECLDLFIAGSVQGHLSPFVDTVLDFFAERGDKCAVKADQGKTVYVFVKGHHVAVRRFRKDAREQVVLAEPLPAHEYTVGCGERTVSGKEGRELRYRRGVVWVDLRPNDTGTMAGQYGRTELKPGTYRVYGSGDMYSMIDATRRRRYGIPLDEAVEKCLVTDKEAARIRSQCPDDEEPVLISG